MASRAPLKRQSLNILRDRGVPVGTVLDVGVFHGTPELIASFPDVKHVLFEPVADFEPQIRRAYARLDSELYLVALGEEESEAAVQLHARFDANTVSHATVSDETSTSSVPASRVARVRLDTFLDGREYSEPFLLKIDVDGAEMEVVRGAAGVLPKCSVVIVECAGNALPERIAAIQNAGFRLFDLSEPCYYDGSFWQCDAIFVRRDIHTSLFSPMAARIDPKLYQRFTG